MIHISMNALNIDFSVSNEHVNNASLTLSTVVTNNDVTMSSQRSTLNNVTIVAGLNPLNQNNVEIINVDDNNMISNNESTIDWQCTTMCSII